MEERWAENPEVVGSTPILNMMIWCIYGLNLDLFYSAVNSWVFLLIFYSYFIIALINYQFAFLDSSNIENVPNLLLTNKIILTKDIYLVSEISSDNLNTLIFTFNYVNSQPFIIYVIIILLIFQFFQKNEKKIPFNPITILYKLFRYLLYSLNNILTLLTNIKLMIIKQFLKIQAFNYFNLKYIFLLWKPLFKRWSYAGFYFKAKTNWLFKNRQNI